MTAITRGYGDKKKYLLFIKLSFFTSIIFYNLLIPCQSHLHEHINEPPSFKYSKQANEYTIKKQLQDQSHKDHDQHFHFGKNQKPHWRPLSDYVNHIGDVFIQAMGSTLLISLVPFVTLYFVPVDNTKECEPLLKILLSFASGGLLGDAFLHLIPHALLKEEHHHEHSHDSTEEDHSHEKTVGLCVLSGIVIFLLIEKTVHLIKAGHNRSHQVPEQENEKETPSEEEETSIDEKETTIEEKETNNEEKDNSDIEEQDSDKEVKDPSDKEEQDENDNFNNISENEEEVNDIKIAGYLNLAADFLHNFTDGLAIGASYLAGNTVGYVTSFTILLHEVPHEIGDFAILIQNGCSKKKALMLQLVTAVGALLGTFISLLIGGMGDVATNWILPFTAGGFIYIATVSVIPELLTNTKFWQSIKEIIAILIGVYMMVLVAEYEGV